MRKLDKIEIMDKTEKLDNVIQIDKLDKTGDKTGQNWKVGQIRQGLKVRPCCTKLISWTKLKKLKSWTKLDGLN